MRAIPGRSTKGQQFMSWPRKATEKFSVRERRQAVRRDQNPASSDYGRPGTLGFSEDQACSEFGGVLRHKLDQGVAAVKAEFGGYVRPVSLDGSRADAQLVGNLFSGFVFGDQPQDAAL